jgi:hypothetical protein
MARRAHRLSVAAKPLQRRNSGQRIMPSYYQITIKGHLDTHWSAWFEHMTISNEANGQAVLRGPLADQAALYGVLIKIRDLGLPLLAVTTLATDEVQNNQS